jgi:hypothetical protein
MAQARAPHTDPAAQARAHSATVKASGNVDNEGLTRWEREAHRFGFRRAAIFRRYQADLGLLLAALGFLGISLPSLCQ